MKLWGYMQFLCESFDFTWEPIENNVLDDEFYNEIYRLFMPNDTNFMYSCKYMGVIYDCNEIFRPIITDEGVCVTFNMLTFEKIFKNDVIYYEKFFNESQVKDIKSSTWNVEDGYSANESMETFPRRALFSGARNSLVIEMAAWTRSLDYLCKMGLQGYKVVLHTPMRFPMATQQYFRVPLNQDIVGAIQPIMMETSDTIKMYSPQDRLCYFASERNLTYFDIYTQNNCKLECLTTHTLKKCGCVNFYMPRFENTSVCTLGDLKCAEEAEHELQTISLLQDLLLDDEKKVSKNKKKRKLLKNLICDCLPTCNDLSYDVETSQSDWEWQKFFKAFKPDELTNLNESEVSFSRLTLFFKYSQFVTSKRSELYGPTDFLANFGGLLGLFTGFSVLSLMEIIYFLTVRICCNVRLYGFWAGPEN